VRLLLDTQLLIWASSRSQRLSLAARDAIELADTVAFSVVSIWEVAIKRAKHRASFDVAPEELREGLLGSGYHELPIAGAHALEVPRLPPLHGDPFDRMLVAQARAEGLTLLTADRTLSAYGAPVQLV
jgi:PIN domain nuclease of toxin-antitoxin system